MCSGPLAHPSWEGRFTYSVQWALHLSWERRFTECAVGTSSLLKMRLTQCAVGPSSLLRDEAYPVCSWPFIPLERRGLPSVQWAPHPSWAMRFIGLPSVQWAPSSSLLREEVYIVYSGPYVYWVCSERGGIMFSKWNYCFSSFLYLNVIQILYPIISPIIISPIINNKKTEWQWLDDDWMSTCQEN